MKPETDTCTQAIAAVANALHSRNLAAVPAETLRHLSGCTRCRAALLLLVQGLDGQTPHPPTPISCATCQADLAAFVDAERADPARAAERFPHVWWHLWTCAVCAETYRLTGELYAALERGELEPLQEALQSSLPVAANSRQTGGLLPDSQFRLPARLFQRLLAASTALGPALGAAVSDIALTDDAEAGYVATLRVQPQTDGDWAAVITIRPALAGWAMVTFGTETFRAPFDAAGVAVIAALPADWLQTSAAPDLLVTLSLDAAAPPGQPEA